MIKILPFEDDPTGFFGDTSDQARLLFCHLQKQPHPSLNIVCPKQDSNLKQLLQSHWLEVSPGLVPHAKPPLQPLFIMSIAPQPSLMCLVDDSRN